MDTIPRHRRLNALIVSQRGVVFFRKQDDLTDEYQKQLVLRMGEITGGPKTSKLHIHPLSNFDNRAKGTDDNINIISTDKSKNLAEDIGKNHHSRKQSNLLGWHSDISYEPVPSSYTALRLTQLPRTGGGMNAIHRDCDKLTKLLKTLSGHLRVKYTTEFRNHINDSWKA